MTNTEVIQELYKISKDIDVDEVDEMVINAVDPEEKVFLRGVSDLILQQNQKKAIAEGRF